MAAIREAEALTFANDTVHALQGYLFSSDDARAEFVAINSLANEPDRSDEGYRVICNAQWLSVEAYQAMRENPAPLPYLQQALAIARVRLRT